MKVAVLLPFQRDREGLAALASAHELVWLADDRLDFACPDEAFDIVAYTERCSEVIRREGIEAVLYSHEPANLVAAVLCERHGLPGPTLDAMLRANHKVLSRRTERDPIWFDTIDLRSGRCEGGAPRYPCFLKPAYLWQSLFGFRLDGPEQLAPALTALREGLPGHCRPYREFFARYADAERYPVLAQDVALLEQYLPHTEQHCVMGWSDAEGRPHRWGLYDRTFYPGGSRAPDASWAPSELPAGTQQALFDHSAALVGAHGIAGGFWNVDLCRVADRWHTIEVNGRAASVWHGLDGASHGRSLFRGMLALACGETPDPSPTTRRVAGQFHVVTHATAPAGELLDFELAARRGVQTMIAADRPVVQTSSAGFVLARFELVGEDREALLAEADALRGQLLRRPGLSPGRG